MIKIGDKIVDWVVVGVANPYISPRGYSSTRWTCECICGKIKAVRESSLLCGDSTGCGCRRDKAAAERLRTHKLSQHPLYSVWHGMQRRCNAPSRKDYKHYGGRGISVCERWSGEGGCANFITDMFNSYEKGLEIERIDVNGNYCPENCKWVTHRDQVINRRAFGSNFDTKFIEYNGEKLCLSQWSEKLGLDYKILIDRLGKLGWSVEKAFSKPYRPKLICFEYKGSVYKTCEIFEVPPNVFALAKTHNLPFYQFIANVFVNILTVKVKIARQFVTISPTEDLSHLIRQIKLNKQFINKHGVNLANP